MEQITMSIQSTLARFSSFFASSEAKQFIDTSFEPLAQLESQVYSHVPLYVLIILHSFHVAGMVRNFYREYYLVNYWVAFCAGFGGSHLAALLVGDALPILSNNMVGVIWTMCWWLMNYSPFDVVYKLYKSLPPLQMACKAGSNMARVLTITAKAQSGFTLYPSVILAPVILGTLGGCGGKFIFDLVPSIFDQSRPKAMYAEFTSPTWIYRSGFGIAVFYTASVHWTQVLVPEVARSTCITFLLMHSLAVDILGIDLDPSGPFNELFHFVGCIPRPPNVASKKAEKAQKGKKKAN